MVAKIPEDYQQKSKNEVPKIVMYTIYRVE